MVTVEMGLQDLVVDHKKLFEDVRILGLLIKIVIPVNFLLFRAIQKFLFALIRNRK